MWRGVREVVPAGELTGIDVKAAGRVYRLVVRRREGIGASRGGLASIDSIARGTKWGMRSSPWAL